MASWQVEFAIVPRRALANTPRVALTRLMETDWWSSERLPSGHERHLSAIAPSRATSSSDVQMWGEADGNRVDIWLDTGKPIRMTARVDVRRLDATFGAKLLQFARTADAVLIRSDGFVIEPTVGAFGAALRTSEAWKFAVDPAAFIAAHVRHEDETE
ncbi:MAG TPA: hypothetical protein VGM50_22320 [Gemmatimonadaceae bacterium]|jgi:hypothetical protein